MPIKILMPALSPTMTEGNLAKWLKKEGDKIEPGQVIAEIETDKATMEVEAVDEGVLAKIIVPSGTESVAVNSLIAILIEEGEDLSLVSKMIEDSNHTPISTKKITNDAAISTSSISPEVTSNNNSLGNRLLASPLARRIAAIEGVQLESITGSGPRGRIVKSDVLNAKNTKGQSFSLTRNLAEYRAVPNNNMRKVIAKRLLDSKQNVPHFYLSIECNMDNLIIARSKINDSFKEDKMKKLSVNDFIIKASALALKDVPMANASWTDEATRLYNNVDISIAVAIDGGLITPIIKNADQKNIISISSEMKDLAKRAKENKLSPEEYQGGGFSISNLGMYGIKNFNAIINPPQGCILAVGESSKRAMVINDKIEIATMMDVTLSCDHRVVDGAIGAEFLQSFKKYIESPILMFVVGI